MTKTKEIVDYLDTEYPDHLRASWDSTDGFLEGNKEKEIKKIGVSLELGPDFTSQEFDMLVLHHPPKFGEDKKVTNPFYKKLPNQPAIYALHSRIDATGKINESIAKQIFGKFVIEKILDDGTIIIKLEDNLSLANLIVLLKTKLKKKALKVLEKKTTIQKIAIHGGEGFNQHHVEKAVKEGIDAYLAGDMSHHLAEAAYFHDVTLIDIDHTSEQIGMRDICNDLQKKFPKCNFTYLEQNPFWRIE